MSRTHQSRLRLASEIERHGSLVDLPCDRCCLTNRPCIAMADSSSRLKCSKCVRLGRACVNMSWSSLDRSRKEYASKVAEDEKLLAIVITRLLRNKKILKEVDAKAKLKTQCLMSEMEESGSLESSDCPAADALVGLSPAVWSSMAMLDDFSNVDGTAAVPSGNSPNV